MPIIVYRERDTITIRKDNTVIVLSENQSRYLLKKLADILGYRLNPLRPTVSVTLAPGGLLKIAIQEGKGIKTIVIPIKVIGIYIEVLRQLGPGKHRKRVLARMVMEHLVEDARFRDRLEKYFVGGEFDWEKFFGGREEYYVFFRAPILLLERVGLVIEQRSPYIVVNDDIDNIDMSKVAELIRSL